MNINGIEEQFCGTLVQGWRKQFPIGQAKIQLGMSAWVALEHASHALKSLMKSEFKSGASLQLL